MIYRLKRAQEGASGLLSIFGIVLLLFSLAAANHSSSAGEYRKSGRHYASSAAFYAAESCLQEALIHLRTDAGYSFPYTVDNPLKVGQGECYALVEPDPAEARDGAVLAWGMSGASLRQVWSNYRDAGPSMDDDPFSLMLVLDRSGSMGNDNGGSLVVSGGYVWDVGNGQYVWDASVLGRQPISDAKNAAIRMVLSLDPAWHKVGFVSYAAFAILDSALTDNYKMLIGEINGIEPQGYTNIGGGIKTAAQELGGTPQSKYMILLADGLANRPLSGSSEYDGAPAWVGNNPGNYARWQAILAAEAGIRIYTISLGADADQNLMRAIALDAGGEHYYAPDSGELDGIYGQIRNQIISYELKKTAWQEE